MNLGDRLKARLELSRREIATEVDEEQTRQRSNEYQERMRVTQSNFEARFETLERRLQIEESLRQISLALDTKFVKEPNEFVPESAHQEPVSMFTYTVRKGVPKIHFAFFILVLESSTKIYLKYSISAVEITESDFLNQEKMEILVWEAYCHPIVEPPEPEPLPRYD